MFWSRVGRPASPFVSNKMFDFEKNNQLSSHNEILNDMNEKELILRIINESNFNKQLRSFPHYLVKRAQIVRNATLDNGYINKRREMKANRINIQERFTYYVTESKQDLDNILKNGFYCSESEMNILGNSSYGLHLMKHLDIEIENQFRKKTPYFFCILVKSIIGNTCLIDPSSNNIQIGPNFSVDCHLSREITTQSQPFCTRYNNSLVYIYDCNKFGIIEKRPRNCIPFAIIELELKESSFHISKSISYNSLDLNKSLSSRMRKSLPMNNISEQINKSIIFEKTPKWRELFEKTGSLIDVLKSYLKDTKPSIQFRELMYEKNIETECKVELLKRSKTLSFSAVDLSKYKLTKSTSCITDVYGLDDSVFEENKKESFGEIRESRRNSSYLHSIQTKRRRSYSASLYEETSNFHSKRRISANASLKDQFDFSTDYSNYSSLSSVFEDSISIQSSRKSSSSPSKNVTVDSQMTSEDRKNHDEDADVVYLNDYYEDILSSQEVKAKNKNLDEIKDQESSSNNLSTFQQENLHKMIDFSKPPPPIIPFFNIPSMYVNSYGYQASAYFWHQNFHQNAYESKK